MSCENVAKKAKGSSSSSSSSSASANPAEAVHKDSLKMEKETAEIKAAVATTKLHLREQLDKCDAAILKLTAKKKKSNQEKGQLATLNEDRVNIVKSLRELGDRDDEKEQEEDVDDDDDG